MSIISSSMFAASGGSGASFIGYSTADGGTPTHTIALPAGVSDDDLMLFNFVTRVANQASISGGWSSQLLGVSTGPGVAIKSRIASGEPSFYTVTPEKSNDNAEVILAFRGVSGINALGSLARGSSASADAASITPSQAGILLYIAFIKGSGGVVTYPGGMTPLVTFENSGGSGSGLGIAMLLNSPAGATGGKSATLTSSGDWASILLQLS